MLKSINNINNLRFVRYTLSHDDKDIDLSSFDCEQLFLFAERQSILGVLFDGVEKAYSELSESGRGHFIKSSLLYEWIGVKENIKYQNLVVNERVKELYEIFKKGSFQSCLLKGQGNANYYPNPHLRTSGDIDLWVEGTRDEIVTYIRSLGVTVHDIHLVHATADFYDDVVVEVHFIPACFNNPLRQRRFIRFINENKEKQFNLYDHNVGYARPSVAFNLVYNFVHIYLHVLGEGIGLRQIIDYYYILNHSDVDQRIIAYKQIKILHLEQFLASLMYVMREALCLRNELFLCQPDKKGGEKLLNEIIDGGNFGRYGKYASTAKKEQRIKRGFENIKRNVRFLTTFPGDVLCIPLFKIWHWCWRKQKGYL